MWIIFMLQVSNNKDANSLLSSNFPLPWLPTLNRPKVSVENKSWKTNKVLLWHKTLIVIVVQIVILLQFYVFIKSLFTMTEFAEVFPKICVHGK